MSSPGKGLRGSAVICQPFLPVHGGDGDGHHEHQRNAREPRGESCSERHRAADFRRAGQKGHQFGQGIAQPVEIPGGEFKAPFRVPLVPSGHPENGNEVTHGSPAAPASPTACSRFMPPHANRTREFRIFMARQNSTPSVPGMPCGAGGKAV